MAAGGCSCTRLRLESSCRRRNCQIRSAQRTPFFSPDGSSVAYFSRGALWRTSGLRQWRPDARRRCAERICRRNMDATTAASSLRRSIRDSWQCPRAEARTERLTELNGGRRRARAWLAARTARRIDRVHRVAARPRSACRSALRERAAHAAAGADHRAGAVRGNRAPRLQLPRQSHGGEIQSRRGRHRRRSCGHRERHSDVERIRRARAIGFCGIANGHARVAARGRRRREEPARPG